jgi:hypothetical protein
MIADDRVTVTTVVRTDPATAFRIFTEEIDSWWKRGTLYRLHDGSIRFEGGRLLEGDETIGRVVSWEPGARLQLELITWPFQAGEGTEVEILFQAIGDGTRVTVEHRGWRRPTEAREFRDVVGLWWGAVLPGFARAAGIVPHT